LRQRSHFEPVGSASISADLAPAALLKRAVNGGTLEKAQQMAAHESPRTTKLYDRTNDAVSLDKAEKWLFQRREVEVPFYPINPFLNLLLINFSNIVENSDNLFIGPFLFGMECFYFEFDGIHSSVEGFPLLFDCCLERFLPLL
jgi:hypothetical protein